MASDAVPATLGGVVRSAVAAGAAQAAAALAPAAVACIGIYVSSLESGGGTPVNKETCDCSCWDGALACARRRCRCESMKTSGVRTPVRTLRCPSSARATGAPVLHRRPRRPLQRQARARRLQAHVLQHRTKHGCARAHTHSRARAPTLTTDDVAAAARGGREHPPPCARPGAARAAEPPGPRCACGALQPPAAGPRRLPLPQTPLHHTPDRAAHPQPSPHPSQRSC